MPLEVQQRSLPVLYSPLSDKPTVTGTPPLELKRNDNLDLWGRASPRSGSADAACLDQQPGPTVSTSKPMVSIIRRSSTGGWPLVVK